MQCTQAAGYAVLDLFTLNKPSALPLVISNDPPASADPSTVAGKKYNYSNMYIHAWV